MNYRNPKFGRLGNSRWHKYESAEGKRYNARVRPIDFSSDTVANTAQNYL